MKNTLPCPKCLAEHTAGGILEQSSISWPELSWIYFRCPHCAACTHILIKEGRMSTVNFLGAPGPDWEINTTMLVDGLVVRMDPGFAHAWLSGQHFEYAAK